MKYSQGFGLLELMIALALTAILWITVDSVYASLWLTRTTLEKQHERQRARQLIQSIFAEPLFHAGYLGCRSLADGIQIKTSHQIPESFFIQKGQALKIEGSTLKLHETQVHGIALSGPVPENTPLSPAELKNKSDWLLISDCLGAELIPFGAKTQNAYQPPVTVFPVIIQAWTIKNNTLYAEQIYPPKQSEPMLNGLRPWRWERFGGLLRLDWQEDFWIFELGNT